MIAPGKMNETDPPMVLRGPMMLKEIADAFGVTDSAVWLVEQTALRKIREAFRREAAAKGMTVQEWLFDS